MTTSTISSKGQIVIPAAVRSDMQAEAGMRVEFVKVAEGWLLKAAKTFSQSFFKSNKIISVSGERNWLFV